MTESLQLPSAQDAEAAVLRCLIENPLRFKIRAWEANLSIEMFHHPAHSGLWHLISSRLRDERPVDPASLRDAIRGSKFKDLTVSNISDILLTESDESSWDGYVFDLRDRYAKRVAIQAGMTVAGSHEDGYSALMCLRSAVEVATNALAGATELMDARTAVQTFLDTLQDRYDNGTLPGLSTGIEQIDSRTGGMRKGELWVFGAKTSMGKSVIMLQIAAHVLLELKKKVAIFTLEMGADEVMGRMVSSSRHLPIGMILNPRTCDKASFTKIKEGAGDFKESGLTISENPDTVVEAIAAHCQRLSETKGLDLIVVDYLQKVPATPIKGQNREREVANIASSLKRLAKRLKIPVITATQLNSDGEARESKVIEQDADNVLLIHPKDLETQTLQFWKVRNGKRGVEIPISLNGEYQKFRFLSQ